MISSNNGIPQLPEFRSLRVQTEAPVFPETFPDGQSVLVSGVSEQEACLLTREEVGETEVLAGALLGCVQIIRQFTPDFQTSDLVAHLMSDKEGLHSSKPDSTQPDSMQPNLWSCSLAAPEELAQMLSEFDIPAHVEQAHSSEDLAHYLESGSGVLVALNLGELWNAAEFLGNGDANAVAVAVAVAREAQTGDIVGWYLNDVVAKQTRIPVAASRMQHAWLDSGGWLIVTEIVRGGTL